MKLIKLTLIILVIFLKTGNVLSEQDLFNVNNIELAKKANISYKKLANQAIKKGFNELINKILIEKDMEKLSKLSFSEINQLVSYYQIIDDQNTQAMDKKIFFNIFFDKDKLYEVFYKKGISYSEIFNKEIYFLPILNKDNQVFIYNQNYFYKNWNEKNKNRLLEFILPLENIEIISKLNLNEEKLLDINLNDLFKEYENKNLVLAIIDENNYNEIKIYLKTVILGKKINRNLIVKKDKLTSQEFNDKIINLTSKEIINIVKSQHLVDIRTPSFLNAKLILERKNNLLELNKRLKKIDLIDNIYVQQYNNEYVLLKIKYLGKLDKIIKQLKDEKILLKLTGDSWSLKII